MQPDVKDGVDYSEDEPEAIDIRELLGGYAQRELTPEEKAQQAKDRNEKLRYLCVEQITNTLNLHDTATHYLAEYIIDNAEKLRKYIVDGVEV